MNAIIQALTKPHCLLNLKMICNWTIKVPKSDFLLSHWLMKTSFPGGWGRRVRLNCYSFCCLFPWLYGVRREKGSGFEDLAKTGSGLCSQYKHNWKYVRLSKIDFRPCLKSTPPPSTLPITTYQGLDEGEGKERGGDREQEGEGGERERSWEERQ